ncbi:MAG TPA: hypothetical protein DCS12_08850 [Clostridiales bacterium]|nr:hypothetical protein [Clostridiales bacterium]
MKKKILALTLALMMVLSSTSAFAADQVYYTSFNISDLLRNYGYFNFEPANNNYIKYVEAPIDKEAQTTQAATKEQTVTEQAVADETKASTSTAPSVSNYEKQVVELVNVERQKNGLAPLTLDPAISNVARIKSQDMSANNYFAHQSPTYGSAGDMLAKHGIRYTAWGENIAAGQRTPEEVVNAWMNSPGHRANILASHFTKIGVGYVNNGRPYWTQMFTN